MTPVKSKSIAYPGRTLLIVSTVLLYSVWFVMMLQMMSYTSRMMEVTYTGSHARPPMNLFNYMSSLSWALIIPTIIYLIGYWKAVIGKGYPRALFLLAFTGLVGTIVIFVLPDHNAQKRIREAEQDAT